VSVAKPVRLDFDDYVAYTETHPAGAYELLDGAIYELAPEGDPHARTRSGLYLYLSHRLDLAVYTPWSEISFPAPGWADGPRPDVFVSRGPSLVGGKFAERPKADDIALVIEVSSSSRPKDERRAALYARLGIPEYWLVDLVSASVVAYAKPAGSGTSAAYGSLRRCVRGETIVSSSVAGLSVDANFALQLAG
jgi:Uma2 family endonuclease